MKSYKEMWEYDIKYDEIEKGLAWEAVGASPSCTECEVTMLCHGVCIDSF